MKIKQGARVAGLKPEILLALQIIEPITESFGQELVITSGVDGKHSKNSRHPIGYAVDIRTRDMTDPQRCTFAIKEVLGGEYVALFEHDHIHIQFNGTQL